MDIKTYKLEDNFSRIGFEDEEAVWFGDPCYVVPGWNHDVDIWDKLCDSFYVSVTKQHPSTGEVYTSRESLFDERDNIRVVEIDRANGMEGKFYMWSTAHGDGSYPLTYRHTKIDSLGVDAGCLSLIPRDLIVRWGTLSSAQQLGKFVTEFETAHLSVTEGDMHWGHYDLLTGSNSHEDDEEWDEYWAEQDEEMYNEQSTVVKSLTDD